MNTENVDSFIRTPIESNLLKWSAGQAIFCPNCQSIMDWRKTVVATIHAIKPGDSDETVIKSYVVCCNCWAKRGKIVRDGVEKSNVNLAPKGIKARLEVVDGSEARFDDVE